MADTKISALTGASTPLAGTEVLPIVQSGVTVKVAVSDLTTGRNVSCANLLVSGLTASTALALDGSKNVVSVTNTGSGNNVLATSPTLTTPNIGAATGTSVDVTGLSKAQNFQLDAVAASNYDIRMVRTSGNGGLNTVQTFWNVTFGAGAAGGCLGAYDRTGTYASPATLIGPGGTGNSNEYTIYGFIGVAP
jgi:hypothetical protein